MYNVYSSMLGGFIAMGFSSTVEAQAFINDYHCKIEKSGMFIVPARS